MSWTLYLGLTIFLTVVFTVFSVVARGVLLGIRENYHRYYQKAGLQWTGPTGKRDGVGAICLWRYIGGSLLAALLVVEFVIQPRP